MEECQTVARKGSHNWLPAVYDGSPIEVCSFCGERRDGVPWLPFNPRVILSLKQPAFFKLCSAYVTMPSVDSTISYKIAWGCGGYGTVSVNHPAAIPPTGELILITGDLNDGVICQRCKGCGITWPKTGQQSIS